MYRCIFRIRQPDHRCPAAAGLCHSRSHSLAVIVNGDLASVGCRAGYRNLPLRCLCRRGNLRHAALQSHAAHGRRLFAVGVQVSVHRMIPRPGRDHAEANHCPVLVRADPQNSAAVRVGMDAAVHRHAVVDHGQPLGNVKPDLFSTLILAKIIRSSQGHEIPYGDFGRPGGEGQLFFRHKGGDLRLGDAVHFQVGGPAVFNGHVFPDIVGAASQSQLIQPAKAGNGPQEPGLFHQNDRVCPGFNMPQGHHVIIAVAVTHPARIGSRRLSVCVKDHHCCLRAGISPVDVNPQLSFLQQAHRHLPGPVFVQGHFPAVICQKATGIADPHFQHVPRRQFIVVQVKVRIFRLDLDLPVTRRVFSLFIHRNIQIIREFARGLHHRQFFC